MSPRYLAIPLVFALVLFLWPGRAPADPQEAARPPSPAPSRYSVEIEVPQTPTVRTSAKTRRGESVSIQCSACHSARTPNPKNNAAGLDDFHQGLRFAHGSVGCLSCHDASDYDRLHLADGTSLPYAKTMELCGQCHGPQRRDYDHGAHGGMRGHWDLTKGGRTRNHCVACHDPHAPAYPKVRPVFPPVKDNAKDSH